MVSKENNLGGRSYVVDSIKELKPRSSNIIARLNGSINSVVQNTSQQQDQILKNFSMIIEGDTTIGYRVADDGKTIINETSLKAIVTYRRGLGAMQITSIPDNAFKWVDFETNDVIANSSTAKITSPSTYIVSVDTEFLLSSVEPSYSNTIQLKLNTSVSVKYGTISLYTYSNAETRDELLLSLDNLRWYTNPYDIERDAKFIWRKDSSDGGKTWLYFRIEYEGPQGPPGTSGEGGNGVIVQYQYSDSDREPPLKYIPFMFGGKLVKFKGNSILDNDGEDWETNPQKDAKYKWMRVSTDGGKTWTYSVVTGPEPSFFEFLSSKDSFRQNERGAVDIEETIRFWILRHNMLGNEKVSWKVEPTTLLVNDGGDFIDVVIPVGFDSESFKVSVSVGTFSETLSKTLYGDPQGTYKPTKLDTIYSEFNPPSLSIFPTTLEDGVSPIRDGDYVLVNLPDGDKRYLLPYRYSEKINPSTGNPMGWQPTSSEFDNHSEIMGNCLQEVLASSQTVPSTSAYYGFFQSLVANDAFITFLEAMYLHIKGALYGGGYDKDGKNKNNEQGFYISNIGELKATKADISGKLSCFTEQGDKIFETDTLVTDYNIPIPKPYMWDYYELANVLKSGASEIKFANIDCLGIKFEAGKLINYYNSYGNAFTKYFQFPVECDLRSYVTWHYSGIGKDNGITYSIYSESRGFLYKQRVHGGELDISIPVKKNEIISINVDSHGNWTQMLEKKVQLATTVSQLLIKTYNSKENIAGIKIEKGIAFSSYNCIYSGYQVSFNSDNFLKYMDISFIANALNKGVEYRIASSSLTVNGTLIDASKVLALEEKLIFTLKNGATKEFPLVRIGIVNEQAYEISGAIVIGGSGLGIRVSGITPINNADGIIGTKDKRFKGFFSNLSSLEINEMGTKNKVWGAVANP